MHDLLISISPCSLLFGIFQGCITVYLSRCLFLRPIAATHLEYHVADLMSRTFFKYFSTFSETACFCGLSRPFERAKVIIAKRIFKCNTFFDEFLRKIFHHKILGLLLLIVSISCVYYPNHDQYACTFILILIPILSFYCTKKLPGLMSWELSAKRRKRDLNPRTALTVYTLSRGASSAT